MASTDAACLNMLFEKSSFSVNATVLRDCRQTVDVKDDRAICGSASTATGCPGDQRFFRASPCYR